MNYSIKTAALAVVLLWITSIAAAQNPSLAFEAVSVKPAPENLFVPPVVDPQSFRITASLADLITWAYEIEGYQLSGGPAWLHRDYYQIQARTAVPATPKEMRAMLQSMLADRFKLKLHGETKVMPVYILLVGKSGPRLESSAAVCGEDGCIDVGPGEFFARYARMASTAGILSNMVDRPVLDQTSLSGRYDFHMKFDQSSVKSSGLWPVAVSDGPSIFVAIQDLGLRLEPDRTAVQVLVIDNADKPDAN